MEKQAKRSKGKNFLIAGASAMALLLSSLGGIPVTAADLDVSQAVSIERPSGWKQGTTVIHVTVDASALGEEVTISKVEAKVGDEPWQDISSTMAVTITTNTTVYVRVTDQNGKIYEQNRSIRCYDTEKPVLSASLSQGILTIQGQDSFSGIAKVTVNGADYYEIKDGLLKIQMTQKDFTTKKIEMSVTDGAGNQSELYSLQNPYYEWAVKQAIAQQADSSGNYSTTTTPGSGETIGQKQEITAPLPQNVTPSDPTEARGTVEDRTVTGIEQELAQKNETVDTISSTTTAGGKEFYTISTKSGKVFYLIIDKDSTTDNVYFLTEVDNQDLMNFTLSDTVTLPAVDTVYATMDEVPLPTVEPTPVVTVTPEPEQEVTAPEKPETNGIWNLVAYGVVGLLALVTMIAAALGLKVYKEQHPKFEEPEYDTSEETKETYVMEDE